MSAVQKAEDKKGTGKLSAREFMDKPVVRNILPVIGLILIVIIFAVLTDGQIVEFSNLKLLLSQTYVLMIASCGVFLIMSMGCLDFSHVLCLAFLPL